MPNHITTTPAVAETRVISEDEARAQGVSARSLRSVASWNIRCARREKGASRERLLAQADALDAVADRLRPANDNRRRGA